MKLTLYFGTIASLLCLYSIYTGMDGAATILGGGVVALAAKYSHDETSKPSSKRDV